MNHTNYFNIAMGLLWGFIGFGIIFTKVIPSPSLYYNSSIYIGDYSFFIGLPILIGGLYILYHEYQKAKHKLKNTNTTKK